MQHVGLLHEKEITAEYGDKAHYLFHEVRMFASVSRKSGLSKRVCRLQFDSEQKNAISLEELWMAFEKQNKEGDLWIESAAV